ncbi:MULTISPECIES: cytochrome-c peroxidase [Bradyrhizobium]|uniref:cytochrome-c peroxidase n=1 Tax=Bradyrhizobium TaxID=374 RepID=UPI001F0AECEC|nr:MULTISPECIES: cytochrome c peroxidase [Bradyrhizobium]MCP1739204.1 cytochrome c peroxidase [Bradyrhizobium japonicum]MCP1856877.1 cytochrome c peroxidase [Bradyrhizobium japonicum]MCP1887692.1 cytochrome c peroxidase [Bradyrhizobium japonicum]MCW2320663.1 cytochrome c peroxidase [Bradyrhizobium japonicum]MDI2074768.1 cytochrome c peroxidase [Bradyrhizobium sp. Mp27]
MPCSLKVSPAPSQSPSAFVSVRKDEPITPIPAPPVINPLKVKLGERLFSDRRLSHDNSRSCASCHDIATNGASPRQHDVGPDGAQITLNTLTVFNAALSFRFGWEGKLRNLEADTRASLESPRTMASSSVEIAEKLNADPDMRESFFAAYGHRPERGDVVDALANFQRTLVTPGGKFDRWLAGDAAALSGDELAGYQLFKSLGCASCHQGVNVGGNLFQRHGIFHPLASPEPKILRVPSLRNVATTPPYFHDGSAPTLDDAVRKMAFAQLNATLTEKQVKALVAFLNSLTGTYRGATVGGSP